MKAKGINGSPQHNSEQAAEAVLERDGVHIVEFLHRYKGSLTESIIPFFAAIKKTSNYLSTYALYVNMVIKTIL